MGFSLFKKVKIDINPLAKNKKFEETKNLNKLYFLIIVVNKGQGIAINNILMKNNCAINLFMFGEGTKEKYISDLLSASQKDKEVILTVVSETDYPNIKKELEDRFKISKSAKGVFMLFDIKSIAGVLAYKYLSDFEGAKKYVKSKK